ncbi:ATPase associated with various cellular activities AAA_3 [Haladaptatus paucihalophilus DX253]|uniref:ATPase associated with various cellular activities AAA_3 n=3 Tax=Haladaptatus paucihalophilus DX253 TaxID=797209 RepID=E7QWB8_HALPU|nr:MoxR family ATPase [Haladaptatus paucihalophilus]EFW91014.1 ATPase associated with various cellular activities AAA_3 [Haladaptatus paucihalophilus DX253]
MDPQEIYSTLTEEMNTILIGNDDVIEGIAIALFTRGHILLEGVPGVAKTTIANAFAHTTGFEFNRIQMTPDLLPADITGTHVYREGTGEFSLQRGPIFSNLLVADEINRATPKTQSALLEGMQERTVTIEGDTLSLPSPFMVIATQNPIEMEGTYELPEAQRDRFQCKLTVDLPSDEDEIQLIDRFNETPNLNPTDLSQVVSADDILDARERVRTVHVAESVKSYIQSLVSASRTHSDLAHGGSPRATLALLHTAKARAAIHGRDYVIPDDVKALAVPVMRHRLVLSTEAELSDRSPVDVVRDLLDSVAPPSSVTDDSSENGDTIDTDVGTAKLSNID